MNVTKAPQPELSWQDNQPYSNRFNDVYFSSDNGLLETKYVFLGANHLESRWQSQALEPFTIIETGFGTGLNFLMAAQLWHQCAKGNAQLHFISVEKYPLSYDDLKRALSTWPTLATLATELAGAYADIDLNQYPQTVRLTLNGNIHLTLHLNDAADALNQETSIADAWFLDGFAPAKNPDMWNAGLFKAMAKRSHNQLSQQETTFATFTSAGVVKRGLQSAGFNVFKQAGFGKKREMLFGHYAA